MNEPKDTKVLVIAAAVSFGLVLAAALGLYVWSINAPEASHANAPDAPRAMEPQDPGLREGPRTPQRTSTLDMP